MSDPGPASCIADVKVHPFDVPLAEVLVDAKHGALLHKSREGFISGIQRGSWDA